MLKKLPGIIDCHVHLREPGAVQKEDFYTGTCAAAAGGVVAVIDMPNNPEPTTSPEALSKKERLAAESCVCDYGFFYGADDGNWTKFDQVADRTFGLKIYMDHTTGPLLVKDLGTLEECFKHWPKDSPIVVHAEDSSLAKAIGLALTHGKWLHVCHVSQECELDIIESAKALGNSSGFRVTCEANPYHLFLSKEDKKKLGSYAKIRPPLRSPADQQALWKAVREGLVDYLATDHAPHTKEEKESDNPPSGVPGLETFLPLMLNAVIEKRITLERFLELTHSNPSRLHNIKTQDSWIEVDLGVKHRITNDSLETKCGWAPFDGWAVRGRLLRTFIRGEKVYEDSEILVDPGFGRLITRA